LKEELKFIIEVIKEQENFTELHEELHEEKIYTSISGDMKITFTGIIDKIKYKKEHNETIVAIIDYKTGNPNLDLTTIPYGIGMQLPIYLYLARNSKKLENVKVAGFYLQKVLNNEVTVDNTHTYEQLKKKNLLLQGYSNEDISILSHFDTSYMDSNIIKSMKVKNDNSFYSYSKVLSSKEMDYVANLAEKKIEEGAKKIISGEFKISPKKIGKINHGCNLCKFKDICYHTNADIEELKVLTQKEVLGGEDNGMD
ncbi:MAG: PD-(D/E)XK nuclease family protein, partial [Bacilli bacterium]|nr:PD-(D/E)XK nuclease family protein [Bacilli bacterium]